MLEEGDGVFPLEDFPRLDLPELTEVSSSFWLLESPAWDRFFSSIFFRNFGTGANSKLLLLGGLIS